MFNWFDLMRQTQGSTDFEAMARHFNLSTEQTQRAMAAFLPAFAMGLQHAFNPQDPMQFFRAMANSPFATMWGPATQVFTPQAQQAGKRVLDQLFGSDEVSRRIAHQAADFAGVGVETMQQMLPLMAGIFAGGLHQWMKSHEQMMNSFTKPASSSQQLEQSSWIDFWSSWLRTSPSTDTKTDTKTDTNPFEAMMTALMRPQQQEPPEPQPSAASPDVWEQMIGTGREMQKHYLASLQSILDSAWNQQNGKP